MHTCSYELINAKRVITAQEFGYWSLQWAFDSANTASGDLCSRSSEIQLFSAPIAAPLLLQVQLAAMHGACYWMHGLAIPQMTNRISLETYVATMASAKVGLDDAANGLRNSAGDPYPSQLPDVLIRSFGIYYQSLQDDLKASGNGQLDTLNLKPVTRQPISFGR